MSLFLKKLGPGVLANFSFIKKACGLFSKTKDRHKHNLVYHAKCPECDESFVGETGGRLQDRFDEHLKKDSK